jgi:hypothetical protein
MNILKTPIPGKNSAASPAMSDVPLEGPESKNKSAPYGLLKADEADPGGSD